MDSSILIQSIKSQIENLKLQIDNIETQNNSSSMNMGMGMGMMDNPSKVGEQLINLSIQMFNVGIQAFNAGKSNFEMIINLDKFHDQLKKVSEKIKKIISDYEDSQQQMTMQQQMMQQQMMQQQMMQQQMMQQQMMQQQMMQQQMMEQAMMQNQMQELLNEKYFDIKFKKTNGEINKINIKGSKKIKDLLDKYISDVYGPFTQKKLAFIYDGAVLERNGQRKVEDCFKNKESYTILVIEGNNSVYEYL